MFCFSIPLDVRLDVPHFLTAFGAYEKVVFKVCNAHPFAAFWAYVIAGLDGSVPRESAFAVVFVAVQPEGSSGVALPVPAVADVDFITAVQPAFRVHGDGALPHLAIFAFHHVGPGVGAEFRCLSAGPDHQDFGWPASAGIDISGSHVLLHR